MTERLYRLDAVCSHGHALPVKAYESTVRAVADWPPEKPVHTVRCSECRAKFRRITIVTLRARVYQRAMLREEVVGG